MQDSLGLQNAPAKKKFLWISHLIFTLIVCITLYPSSLALVRSGNILLPTPARDWQGRRVCGHRRKYLQIASSSNLKECSSCLEIHDFMSTAAEDVCGLRIYMVCKQLSHRWLFPVRPWRWLVGRRIVSWYCHGHVPSMALQQEHSRPYSSDGQARHSLLLVFVNWRALTEEEQMHLWDPWRSMLSDWLTLGSFPLPSHVLILRCRWELFIPAQIPQRQLGKKIAQETSGGGALDRVCPWM